MRIKNSISNRLRRQSGYTLIWVLILLVTLSLLGATILAVSVSETRFSTRSYRRLQTEYAARSGVETGYKLLTSITTPQNSVDALKNQASLLINPAGYDLGDCHYSLLFKLDQTGYYIIIESTAVSKYEPTISSVVSLYVVSKISGSEWTDAPKEWARSSNLWDGVVPGNPATSGMAISITGTPTKSPQNAVDPSQFQAAVLFFRGLKQGVTFVQQVNTNEISLNAEAIIFEGGVELREPDVPLILLNDNPGDLDGWSYEGGAGFENLDVYLNFIDGIPYGYDESDYDDPSDKYGDLMALHNSYSFDGESVYGLLYLGGPIINSDGNTILTQGYYFYPSGIDLTKDDLEGQMISLLGDPIEEVLSSKLGDLEVLASTKKDFYQAGSVNLS